MSTAVSTYFYQHHTPSGQSRVYRVTQLLTDGVHCRECVGIGPVVLKVARVTGAAFASPWTKCYCAPLFSHTHYWYKVSVFKLSRVCVCVCFLPIYSGNQVGRTSRGHAGGKSHGISHPPSFCGACLNFSRAKGSAIPFPRRP